MDIEEFLNVWKHQLHFGLRDFKKCDSPSVVGQSLYFLSLKGKVEIDGVIKEIEKNRFFQTWVQGLTEKDGVTLNGDIYVCQQILNQLEAEFFKEYNDFIDGEIR